MPMELSGIIGNGRDSFIVDGVGSHRKWKGLANSMLVSDIRGGVNGGKVEREPLSMCTAQQQPHFSAWSPSAVFRGRNSIPTKSRRGDSGTHKVPVL